MTKSNDLLTVIKWSIHGVDELLIVPRSRRFDRAVTRLKEFAHANLFFRPFGARRRFRDRVLQF